MFAVVARDKFVEGCLDELVGVLRLYLDPDVDMNLAVIDSRYPVNHVTSGQLGDQLIIDAEVFEQMNCSES